jgi:hypothetical protein
MLTTSKTLMGYSLHGRDGDMGSVRDFYFDDNHWAVRYLVVDTGNWLRERQVLISPYALTAVVRDEHHIDIDLTRQQVNDSPSLDDDKPVSRQFEKAYYGYYQWPSYWGGPNRWGYYPHIAHDRDEWDDADLGEAPWDPHLRSINDVSDYHIRAADDEIGHVDDFIIEDGTWAIRYLVIDTRSWWPGKKVLISPRWIERISWTESRVFVSPTRETIKQAPEYAEASSLTRDYETRLHRHYDREGYWIEEQAGASVGGDTRPVDSTPS